MKHVLSIVCNHLCALGPRFFSCSTSMSSMPAALLFLSAAIPFLYSSSLNADTNDGFPSTVGTGQVGLGVGSWPSNRATDGSNPKGTRLYFVILLKNVEKIFDWH